MRSPGVARWGSLALLLALVGCEQPTAAIPGLQTRVYIDRTEARVGDAIGVTIEIETPEGFDVVAASGSRAVVAAVAANYAMVTE